MGGMTKIYARRGTLAAVWLLGAGCIGDVELGGDDASASESSTSTGGPGPDATESPSADTSSDGESGTQTESTTAAAAECDGGVVEGNVVLATQADVEALAGCHAITGWLAIVDDVQSLVPLAGLSEIGGDLLIGVRSVPDADGLHDPPPLTSLAGLDALDAVGGSLELVGLGELPSLEGLQNIERIGGRLRIENCTALADLHGLRNLAVVGTDLWLDGLSMSSFGGLESLAEIGEDGSPGYVQIDANPALVDLAGFEHVVWHDQNGLGLHDNDALIDLSALGTTTELGELLLSSNDALTDLDDLAALERLAGDLNLHDNHALADIGGLGGLQSAAGLNLLGTHAFDDLGGLDGLVELDNVTIADSNLVDFGPLPALAQIGAVTLRGNPELTQLSALVGVTQLAALTIEDDDAFTDLGQLDALAIVDDGLRIVLDDALPQLDAESWAAARQVGGLTKVAANLGWTMPETCPYEDDFECDEPELCAEGTDEHDCGVVPGG